MIDREAAVSNQISFFRSQLHLRRFDERTLRILESIIISKDVKSLLEIRNGVKKLLRSESVSFLQETAEKSVEQKLFVLEFFVQAFALVADVEDICNYMDKVGHGEIGVLPPQDPILSSSLRRGRLLEHPKRVEGRHTSLTANQFSVCVDVPNAIFFHRVSIKLGNDHVEGKGIRRKVMDKLHEKYSIELAEKWFAYDGEKAFYMMSSFPRKKFQFTVTLDKAVREWSLSIFDAKIPKGPIALALKGLNAGDTIIVIDIILRQQAAESYTSCYWHFIDLGGVSASHGFYSCYHAVQCALLLNMDVSSNLILTPGIMLDFTLTSQNLKDCQHIDWERAKGLLMYMGAAPIHKRTAFNIVGTSYKICDQLKWVCNSLPLKMRSTDDTQVTVDSTIFDCLVDFQKYELSHSAYMPCLDISKPNGTKYLLLEGSTSTASTDEIPDLVGDDALGNDAVDISNASNGGSESESDYEHFRDTWENSGGFPILYSRKREGERARLDFLTSFLHLDLQSDGLAGYSLLASTRNGRLLFLSPDGINLVYINVGSMSRRVFFLPVEYIPGQCHVICGWKGDMSDEPVCFDIVITLIAYVRVYGDLVDQFVILTMKPNRVEFPEWKIKTWEEDFRNITCGPIHVRYRDYGDNVRNGIMWVENGNRLRRVKCGNIRDRKTITLNSLSADEEIGVSIAVVEIDSNTHSLLAYIFQDKTNEDGKPRIASLLVSEFFQLKIVNVGDCVRSPLEMYMVENRRGYVELRYPVHIPSEDGISDDDDEEEEDSDDKRACYHIMYANSSDQHITSYYWGDGVAAKRRFLPCMKCKCGLALILEYGIEEDPTNEQAGLADDSSNSQSTEQESLVSESGSNSPEEDFSSHGSN